MPFRVPQETGTSKGQETDDIHNRRGLPKTERLSGKKKIRGLFSKGKRFSCGDLILIYLFGKKQKAGFVASKRIGGAVKRNSVKRILREAYRMNKQIFRGLEIIFYARGHLDLDKVIDIFQSFQAGR